MPTLPSTGLMHWTIITQCLDFYFILLFLDINLQEKNNLIDAMTCITNKISHNIYFIVFFLFNAFFIPHFKKQNAILTFIIDDLFFLFNLELKRNQFRHLLLMICSFLLSLIMILF